MSYMPITQVLNAWLSQAEDVLPSADFKATAELHLQAFALRQAYERVVESAFRAELDANGGAPVSIGQLQERIDARLNAQQELMQDIEATGESGWVLADDFRQTVLLEYARDIVDNLDAGVMIEPGDTGMLLCKCLNGAQNWQQYSEGSSLVYTDDINERFALAGSAEAVQMAREMLQEEGVADALLDAGVELTEQAAADYLDKAASAPTP